MTKVDTKTYLKNTLCHRDTLLRCMHSIEVIKLFLTNIFVHNLVRDFYQVSEENVATLSALMHYASSIGTALACLLWAFVHDRYHSHRLIFRVGILCGLFACFLIPTVPSIAAGILVSFFLNGLGSGIYLITYFEVIKHCHPSKILLELNVIDIFFLAGDTLATVIGGVSTNTSLEFKLPYGILAVLLCISLVCGETYCKLHSDDKEHKKKEERDSFLVDVYRLVQGSDDIEGVHGFCMLICLYKAIDACMTFAILSVLDSPEDFNLDPMYKMVSFACLSVTSIILKSIVIMPLSKRMSSSVFTFMIVGDIAVGLFLGYLSFNDYGYSTLNWVFIIVTIFCAAFSNTNAEMVASDTMLGRTIEERRLQMSVLIFISQLVGSAFGGVVVVFLLFLAENAFGDLKYIFLESEVFLFIILCVSAYVYQSVRKIHDTKHLQVNMNVDLPQMGAD